MDPTIEQVLKETLESSFESKVATGKEALQHLISGLRAGKLNDNQISQLLTAFTKLFVSADKDCTDKEYEFFKKVVGTNLSKQEFYDMTNYGSNSEFVDQIFGFIHILNHEDRIALIIYGACLVSADGSVTHPEASIIDRILSC